VSRPSDLCFDLIERHVDDLITVDDHMATAAVALPLERAKYLVEPSGAVGVAALLNSLIPNEGRTVAVLSGGNIDLLLLDSVIRQASKLGAGSAPLLQRCQMSRDILRRCSQVSGARVAMC